MKIVTDLSHQLVHLKTWLQAGCGNRRLQSYPSPPGMEVRDGACRPYRVSDRVSDQCWIRPYPYSMYVTPPPFTSCLTNSLWLRWRDSVKTKEDRDSRENSSAIKSNARKGNERGGPQSAKARCAHYKHCLPVFLCTAV